MSLSGRSVPRTSAGVIGIIAILAPALSMRARTPPREHEGREGLLAADRGYALVAASHAIDGFREMLAADVVLLEPAEPVIRGRDAALATLRRADSSGVSTATWDPIRADVSADGTQGYTYGYGSATRPTSRYTKRGIVALRYATYWRKGSDGTWRAAAYARVFQDSAPPASTRPRLDQSTEPPADARSRVDTTAERARLMEADRAFADRAEDEGVVRAFYSYAASDAAWIGPGPGFTVGRGDIRDALAAAGDAVRLAWRPLDGSVAPSGDLGFTVGEAVRRATIAGGGSQIGHRKYLTVWKRRPGGDWRFVVDGGNTRPAATVAEVAVADSSSAARSAWARASAAFGADDLVVARREAAVAAKAWPTQPAYVWGHAITSAMAGDTADMLAALGAYAALGLGRDLHNDRRFSRYLALVAMAPILDRHDRNRAPAVRSRVRASLPDSSFWPEGADYDARTRRFYVASVRHRTIAELTAQGVVRELWPREQPGIGAMLGVRVDTARNVLWATMSGVRQMAGYTARDSAIAALVRVRLPDGVIERRWDLLPSPNGHVLGDLAVGPRGDVFVTDSDDPTLYRLRPGADTLERITSPLFHSLQGLAPTPDGRFVYLSDYSHGLLRVDLEYGSVLRLADAPRSTALGCDGIVLDRNAIVAVQNGVSPARVMRFVLDARGERIVRTQVLDQNTAIADEPTIGTIVDRSFVYVANSQWEKYEDNGTRKPKIPLTAPVLLEVRLPR